MPSLLIDDSHAGIRVFTLNRPERPNVLAALRMMARRGMELSHRAD